MLHAFAVLVKPIISMHLPSFQLNEYLVDTISNIMDTEETLLQEAQRRTKACSRFVPLDYCLRRYNDIMMQIVVEIKL